MKIIIAENYEAMSQQAANDLATLAAEIKTPVVCTASGDTPAGMYKMLVQQVNNSTVSVNNWYFLGLDEWAGMNGDDEGSCRFHLNNQLLHPLAAVDEQIVFFDGKANDLTGECNRIEDFIKQHNGIDIAVLGLGMNGHIGMNEPGTAADSRSHISKLDELTKQVGQKYFTAAQTLTNGVTLGLSTLMDSKHIMLLVSGKHKATIVQKMLEGEISNNLPASLFRTHPGLRIYLDKDAAQLLPA